MSFYGLEVFVKDHQLIKVCVFLCFRPWQTWEEYFVPHVLKGKSSPEAWLTWSLCDVTLKTKDFTAHFASGNDGFEGSWSTCRDKQYISIYIYMYVYIYMSIYIYIYLHTYIHHYQPLSSKYLSKRTHQATQVVSACWIMGSQAVAARLIPSSGKCHTLRGAPGNRRSRGGLKPMWGPREISRSLGLHLGLW